MYKNKKQYRLPNYDYSEAGYYFVTICTKNREEFFGENQKGKMVLSQIGEIVQNVLISLPEHHHVVVLDYVIMTDHLHCILKLGDDKYREINCRNTARCVPTDDLHVNIFGPLKSGNLSTIIRSFKSECTKQSKSLCPWFSWQSRFHDRVIRDEDELIKIQDYIYDNPRKHYLKEINEWD